MIQGDVAFDSDTHRYEHIPTGTPLVSVTSVIKAIGKGTDYSAADPAAVEFARIRGKAVDDYLSEYLVMGRVTIRPDETLDVIRRFEIGRQVIDDMGCSHIDVQPIRYSVEDGIAGTIDFIFDRKLACDLKNMRDPSPVAWRLQLGAAIDYGHLERGMILQIAPRVYRDTGFRIFTYDGQECRDAWREAVYLWKHLADHE